MVRQALKELKMLHEREGLSLTDPKFALGSVAKSRQSVPLGPVKPRWSRRVEGYVKRSRNWNESLR